MEAMGAKASSLRGALRGGKLGKADAEATQKELAQLDAHLNSVEGHLERLFEKVPLLSEQIAGAIFNTFQSLSQGVGNSIANAIVYGEDLASSMAAVMKQVAASIISTVIQIMIQNTIASAVRKTEAASVGAAEVGAATAAGAAWTWASAVKSLGLIGLIVGAGLAAAFIASAIASSKSGASAGKSIKGDIAAAAEGGIFSGRRPFLIAETGKEEIALTRDNIRRFGLGGGGDRPIVIHTVVKVREREIGRASARYMPDYLEMQGVPIR